jgi:thiamine kinase-like enzyme
MQAKALGSSSAVMAEPADWSVSFGPGVDAEAAARITAALAEWSPAALGTAEVLISPLDGGANNLNFTVEGDGVKAALRIAGSGGEALGIDRLSGYRAQVAAAGRELAPPVWAWSPGTGNMLTGFVEGETLGRDAFEDRRVLALVARLLRQLHGTAADIRRFSPFEEIRLNVARVEGGADAFPEEWTELQAAVDRIEIEVAALGLPEAVTHNDLVPQNFILEGDRLRLVDWDFAGYGRPTFELGSLACTAQLGPEQIDDLLAAYGGDAQDRRLLTAMSFVAAAREVAWAVSTYASIVGREQVEKKFYEDHRDDHLAVAKQLLREDAVAQVLRKEDR